jgi:hypothetical protein
MRSTHKNAQIGLEKISSMARRRPRITHLLFLVWQLRGQHQYGLLRNT